jgi:hypothetical protein
MVATFSIAAEIDATLTDVSDPVALPSEDKEMAAFVPITPITPTPDTVLIKSRPEIVIDAEVPPSSVAETEPM